MGNSLRFILFLTTGNDEIDDRRYRGQDRSIAVANPDVVCLLCCFRIGCECHKFQHEPSPDDAATLPTSSEILEHLGPYPCQLMRPKPRTMCLVRYPDAFPKVGSQKRFKVKLSHRGPF